MTRIEFSWPDEASEAVRAARGRLEIAGGRLASRPFEERLRVVAGIVDVWSRPDSPWRRELSERLACDSGFHRATIDEGLDSALRAWDPKRFAECARREIGDGTGLGRIELVPYSCTSVLAGGSIPMPTLLSGILPLVLGSPVLLRESSKDAVTGELLGRSIAECDRELGECLEIVRFAVEDVAAMDLFLESPCVVATGSDDTISSIRRRLTSNQRFVAYGHRFSIAVLGPHTTRSEAALERTLEGLALDVARWDQLGCLSPVDVYLVGLSLTASKRVAEGVAEALEGLSISVPRGKHPPEMLAAHSVEGSEARMRAAVEEEAAYFDGGDFAVVLESDARARPAPLMRFLHLLPVPSAADLGRALGPFSSRLSSAALAGFDETEAQRIGQELKLLGVSRLCKPGHLQTPPIDWPHDGMPLFTPMARFSQRD
jgi:hypothetical protein